MTYAEAIIERAVRLTYVAYDLNVEELEWLAEELVQGRLQRQFGPRPGGSVHVRDSLYYEMVLPRRADRLASVRALRYVPHHADQEEPSPPMTVRQMLAQYNVSPDALLDTELGSIGPGFNATAEIDERVLEIDIFIPIDHAEESHAN